MQGCCSSPARMNILIIKTSSLGDVVHALPVLEYLREVVPDARIDWVIDEAFEDLVAGHPALHAVRVAALRRWKRHFVSGATWRELAAFLRSLRATNYNLVFDLQGNAKSALICVAARSPRKIGFARENLQERIAALATDEGVPFDASDVHAAQRYLRVVATPFGVEPDAVRQQPRIATSTADEVTADKALGDSTGPWLLFHGGSSWRSKLWFDAGWIELGRALLEQLPTAAVLLSWGGAEERARAEGIATALGPRARLLPRLGLKPLTAVLGRCALAVAPDTGPLHLAAAAGTATVSIYRCTDGRRNGPFGPRHAIVQAPLDCSACWRGTCVRDAVCACSITPEAVLAAALPLLRLAGGARV